MKYIFLFSLVFLIQSCTSGVDLKPISLGPLLHDSNSKVWMVDKVIVGNKNFAPKKNLEKDIIVFYQNGKCLFQPMRTLGDFVGKKGDYTFYSNERTLTLYFVNEKWDFNISTLTEDTIVIDPTNSSDLKYSMVLVPFPEL